MKTVFKLLWILLALAAVVVTVFALAMVDAPPPDDTLLHLADKACPTDEENAFPDIMGAIGALQGDYRKAKAIVPSDIPPDVADGLITSNAEAFVRLHAAAGKADWVNPEWAVPSLSTVTPLESEIPVRDFMQLARLAQLKARREVGKGEFASAVATIGDLFALAGLLRDNAGSKVCWYVGVATQRLAVESFGAILDAEGLPDEDLESLGKLISSPGKSWGGSVARILSSETAVMATWLDRCRGRDMENAYVRFLPERFQFQPNRTKALLIDWLSRAHGLCGERYDGAAWRRYVQDVEDAARKPDSRRLPPRNHIGRLEFAMCTLGHDLTAKTAAEADFAVAAMKVRVAIARFRRERGRRPATLEELVPEFLHSIPEDPFDDGRPVKYDAARGILYTVGPDCDFDGEDETGHANQGENRISAHRHHVFKLSGVDGH